MKTSTWIKKYAQKNQKPDQKYCPIFGIEWKGYNKKLGSYYKIYTPYNGKLYVNKIPAEIGTDNNRWSRRTLSPRSYCFIGLYVKNIGHGVLEVSYVVMNDGTRGKEGEVRKWEYEHRHYGLPTRIFIDRETLLPYNGNGERLWKFDDGKFYNRELVKTLNSISSYGRMSPAHLKETLCEFCNVDKIYGGWGNRVCDMSHMWHLAEFIRKAKERPKSELSVNLASYDLPKREYTETTIEFYPIDDEYAVFRVFKAETDYDYMLRRYIPDGNPANERARVFIHNDGKVSVMEKQTDNSWNIVGKKLSSIAYVYGDTVNKFDGMYDWQPIKWNMDIIKSASNNHPSGLKVVNYIINLLRHPVIEKLYKMGYKEVAMQLIKNDEVVSRIKEMFYMNNIKEKEKNIYKMLGVNKYILQKMEDNYAENSSRWESGVHLRDIKDIFGTPDISSLSKETIDMYVAGLSKCNYRGWRPLIGDCHYYFHREKYSNPATEEQRRLLEKLFRLELKEPGIVSSYADARGIYDRLRIKPEIDWIDFRHLEDVNILHDNLQGLMNTQEEEYRYHRTEAEKKAAEEREKQFKKLQEDRVEKFECVGEKYSIVTPKNLTEITTEGSSLHHCVGGYLNNHAEGRTNILFLRNNAFPNTPFYTIEVTPDDYVMQIHGKNNRWLGNDPDAISFVWKWIQDRGFRCEKYKLLNMGVGYSRGNEEVSESYLVA